MLHIRRADKTGSAFTLDHEEKQYLVTARHVVEGITSGENIFIGLKKRWETIEINVVGVGEDEVDVAVLACQQQLSPTLQLEPSNMFVYGQQAYFLGFPFGWDSGGERINNGRPRPFAKAGIIEPYTGTPAAGKLPRLTVPDRTGLLWPWLGWCFVSHVRPSYWCFVFAK